MVFVYEIRGGFYTYMGRCVMPPHPAAPPAGPLSAVGCPRLPALSAARLGTRDKYENEELIKHGWEEDVWFHVDKHSSAHVYVRLPRGPIRKQFRETGRLDHLPPGALEDLCQLTKANSIEGCKVTCDIVYTAWENLHKRGDMDTGTIGFRDQKKVIKVAGVERVKEVSNRIEKTKREEVTPTHGRRALLPSDLPCSV